MVVLNRERRDRERERGKEREGEGGRGIMLHPGQHLQYTVLVLCTLSKGGTGVITLCRMKPVSGIGWMRRVPLPTRVELLISLPSHTLRNTITIT